MVHYKKADQIYECVREAVHRQWDPIGAVDLTSELGEYDAYVSGLCKLILSGGTREDLFDHLWQIETESIGLDGNQVVTEGFADDLCKLARDIWEDDS